MDSLLCMLKNPRGRGYHLTPRFQDLHLELPDHEDVLGWEPVARSIPPFADALGIASVGAWGGCGMLPAWTGIVLPADSAPPRRFRLISLAFASEAPRSGATMKISNEVTCPGAQP